MSTATAIELTQIRMAIGDSDSSVFTDDELQIAWSEAGEDYTERKLIRYQTILNVIDWLLVDAAKRVTYRQGSSSENASDVFKHLEKLRESWQAKLDKAARSNISAVKMGRLRRNPSRDKDYPDA